MNAKRVRAVAPILGFAGITLLGLVLWISPVVPLGSVKGLAAPAARVSDLQPVPRSYVGSRWVSDPSSTTADSVTCSLTYTTTTQANDLGNDSFADAIPISNYFDLALAIGNKGTDAPADPDYYELNMYSSRLGSRQTIRAVPEETNNYNLGITIYLDSDPTPTAILTDTDTSDYEAEISFVPDRLKKYYIEVYQITPGCKGGTYRIEYDWQAATPTPTNTPTRTPTPTGTPQPDVPTPQPTWRSGFDQYEPNFDFSIATTLAPGVNYTMNFIPWGAASVDNDFLRVRVKPRLQLTCETSDLDPGVDPRMVFYRGPSERDYIAANDDIELGNFNSRLSYYSNFEGYIDILIGQGQRMAARDTVDSQYTVRCELSPPTLGTIEPTPGVGETITPPPDKDPILPTPTPWPTSTPQAPTSPIPTPTQPPGQAQDRQLSFRLVSQPDTSDPVGGADGVRTFRVVIYLDENQDKQFGAGEGITGFFVMVLRPETKAELAQGYTDEQGQVSFTVASLDNVRLLVPMLGYDRIIPATQPEVVIRINPTTLPDTIP
jgi:hypothetical protein